MGADAGPDCAPDGMRVCLRCHSGSTSADTLAQIKSTPR